MVNFRDPEVVTADFCTFVISRWFWSLENCSGPAFHSGACEALARSGRPLAVSFPVIVPLLPESLTYLNPSSSSWEFLTTLDYEWNLIRGNIPYKKSIWVCGDTSSFAFRCSP